jgi:UDP:flavonoid glycosyltransferase YjiC (YdhE family)
MHITILAVGSRGDVQPFVALARGIREEGHRVRIATHDIHAPLVGEHGLEFASIRGNPKEIMESLAGQAWLDSGRNPISFWRRFRKLMGEKVEESLDDSLRACEGTQGVIFTFFGSSGYHVAEKMGVPHVMGFLQPFSRTRVFPSTAFPPLPLGGTYNRLTYRLAEEMAWQTGRGWVNRWRRDSLGLAPLPAWGAFHRFYAGEEPFVYGFSEHVIPRPGDWPDSHQITGYWFLDGEDSWSPPPELLDFLAAGPPPVSIGFGSMAGPQAQSLWGTALEALAITGKRGVLLGGWAGSGEIDLPETVRLLPSAPHDWLFPRVSAVVHHGGAGTTAAGLRAGRPSVVIPFFADQPFWGRRVHALGVGPRPIPRKQLTAQGLADAILQAVHDADMKSHAAALGGKLRAEDGVGRAVEFVLRHLAR